MDLPVLDWRFWMRSESESFERSSFSGTLRQLFRYVLVGGLTNLLGYSLYLLLTYIGWPPKLAMSALYVTGVVLNFFANRRFTFRHDGNVGSAGIRFLLAHASGYLVNLLMLVILVDWLGFAHQAVQLLAVVVVAVWLFVLFRVFVFVKSPVDGGGPS